MPTTFQSSSDHLSTRMVSWMFSIVRCHMCCRSWAVSWKIRWFLSFHMFHRRKPKESDHAQLITWQWYRPFLQLSIVATILSLFLSVWQNMSSKSRQIDCITGQVLRRCSVVSLSAWQSTQEDGPIIPLFWRFSHVRIRPWLKIHRKYSTLGQCFSAQIFFHSGWAIWWICCDWMKYPSLIVNCPLVVYPHLNISDPVTCLSFLVFSSLVKLSHCCVGGAASHPFLSFHFLQASLWFGH